MSYTGTGQSSVLLVFWEKFLKKYLQQNWQQYVYLTRFCRALYKRPALAYTANVRERVEKEMAVYGFSTVKSLAAKHPKRINRLFLREENLKNFSDICRILAAAKHPYKICDDTELERLCGNRQHQGVVAMIAEANLPHFTEKLARSWSENGETVLFFSSIGGAAKLGAIVRSAAYFGINKLVLFEDDRDARLSPEAYRSAEGGMEFVELYLAKDPPALLKLASENAVIIGTSRRARNKLREINKVISREKRERLGAVAPNHGLGASSGVFLVFGDDKHGLPPDIKALCGALVRVGGIGEIEDLDTPQVAALVLYELSNSG